MNNVLKFRADVAPARGEARNRSDHKAFASLESVAERVVGNAITVEFSIYYI
jgi:hypothetical protein